MSGRPINGVLSADDSIDDVPGLAECKENRTAYDTVASCEEDTFRLSHDVFLGLTVLRSLVPLTFK